MQMNKQLYMQNVFYGLLLITGIAAGCSDGKKAKEGNVNDKKARLEKLKKEQLSLNAEIEKLQKELALTDTSGRVANPKLVALAPVQPQDFTHYIDLQGKIDATNISYVARPNGMGGVVKAL